MMAKKGGTREAILEAAKKVFFVYGYEKTTVKQIREEAHVVTGSFYHFFPSKEALFEAVTARFLEEYNERIRAILNDEANDAGQMIRGITEELRRTADIYYNALQGDHLHWTIRLALHERTLEAMTEPLAEAIARMKDRGEISARLDADDAVLAGILIRGSEALIHSGEGVSERLQSEKLYDDLKAFWNCIICIPDQAEMK